MEFLAGLFVGLTFWHFVWILAILSIGFVSASFETVTGFLIGFVIFMAGLVFLFDVPVLSNPMPIVLGFILYFVCGGLYALFVSWPRFLRGNADNIKFAKLKYDETRNDKDFYDTYHYRDFTASYNVERISAYITLWIFDAIWRVISEPVKWAWETTYEFLATAFVKVGIRVSDQILNDDASTNSDRQR